MAIPKNRKPSQPELRSPRVRAPIFLLARSRRRRKAGFAEWVYSPESLTQDGVCTECAEARSRLKAALQVEWQAGFDQIADVSWAAGDHLALVTASARRRLIDAGWPCVFRRVQVVGSEKRPGFKSVAHPYTGPALYWMVPKHVVEVDVAGCGLKRSPWCEESHCPFTRWEFRYSGPLRMSQSPLPLCFRLDVYEPDSPTYVSEAGRRLLERLELSNLDFVTVSRA